jgi:hypothetical protein
VIWVIVSVMAVILESVQGVHYLLNLEFIVLDAIAVSVFSRLNIASGCIVVWKSLAINAQSVGA